ncbi:MAG: hypothetical protein EXR79_04270 [Myxococcales bacterium]|nr:hypothetical protein [Myxococcales bacterium]
MARVTGFPFEPWLLDRLAGAGRVALMTHVGPDADGLGSQLAFCQGARAAGIDAFIVNEDPLPPRYAWLDPDGLVGHFERDQGRLSEATLGLVFDAHEVERVQRPATWLRQHGTDVWVIDHHAVRPGSDVTGCVATGFSSSGELTYRLLRALGWPVDVGAARCLYAAISFDTGSFRFLRNDPNTLRVAAELIETGLDTNPIQEALWASRSRGELTLLGRVLAKVQYAAQGRVAWAALEPDITDGLDVAHDAVGESIPFLVGTEGVLVAVLLKPGRAPGEWKLSMRSKTAVRIGHIAQELGGGGHAHAAGATLHGDLDTWTRDIVARVVAAVETQSRGQDTQA